MLLARKVGCIILDSEFVQMKLNSEILSDENISREHGYFRIFRKQKTRLFKAKCQLDCNNFQCTA